MECLFLFIYASAWFWVLSVAWVFTWWDLSLSFSILVAEFLLWHTRISWCFCFSSSNIAAEWTIGMTYNWKKYLGEIWFICTGCQFNRFFILVISPEMNLSFFTIGEVLVRVSGKVTVGQLVFGWLVIECTVEDVFDCWKSANV